MAGWTRLVLRFRWPILGFWLIVLLAGGYASSKLTPFLQNTFTEFGLGLAVAIFVDATIVRALLPSLMAVFGRWNWWLPTRVARLVRVRPSPLAEAPTPAFETPGR